MRGLIATLVLVLALNSADAAMLRVTFLDAANNECGFMIRRRTESDASWSKFIWLDARPGSGTVTYVDTGLTAGVKYIYDVLAFNNAGESAPSNTAFNTPINPDPAPIVTQKEPRPIAPCPKFTYVQ